MVALEMAVAKLIKEGKLKETPITNQIAAVSIGLVDGKPCLDLDYIEDSKADTDLNLVMNKNGGFIEIQGTGEEAVFSRAELDKMLDMGEAGIKELFALQDKAIAQL
jgi:ribonuclease PH